MDYFKKRKVVLDTLTPYSKILTFSQFLRKLRSVKFFFKVTRKETDRQTYHFQIIMILQEVHLQKETFPKKYISINMYIYNIYV